jgi:hypothetical protein
MPTQTGDGIKLGLEKRGIAMTSKRDGGLARCETCGKTLIAPYDGQPYWCTECSIEKDQRFQRRRKNYEKV